MPIQAISIFTRLEPYGRGFSRKCPTDNEPDFSYTFPDGRALNFNVPSYGYNVYVGGWERSSPLLVPNHEANVYEPANLITFADGVSGFYGRGRFGFCIGHRYPDRPQIPRDAWGAPAVGPLFPAHDRHLKGANYLYFDGHLKWLPSSDRSLSSNSPTDVPRAWLPNPDRSPYPMF